MKEDKDWDNKLRGWLKVGFRDDYNYIWESFILRDREKQKEKVLEMLNIGLEHSKGIRKKYGKTQTGWKYDGAIEAFKQIKKKLEQL